MWGTSRQPGAAGDVRTPPAQSPGSLAPPASSQGADPAPTGPLRSRRGRLPRWPAGLGFSVLVYGVTRIPFAVAVAIHLHRHPVMESASMSVWPDAWWYRWIAAHGYSASLHPPLDPPTLPQHRYSSWAFYPGYPLAVRMVHDLFALPFTAAAYAAALVCGALAVWAVYGLGAVHGGPAVARASALLFAAWPGSAVLSIPYSEALFVAAAALALALLRRERWVLAGLAGALATGTRPTGVALLAAAAALALVRLVRDHQWRPLLAPLLTAGGLAAFVVHGWRLTGDPLVWRHAENLWQQQLDFSRELVGTSLEVLSHLHATLQATAGASLVGNVALDALGLCALALMAVAAVAMRRRVTIEMLVFALVSVGLIIGYSAVAPRPRTVLVVVPGFVWLAQWLPRWVVAALSVVGFAGIGVVTFLWMGVVVP